MGRRSTLFEARQDTLRAQTGVLRNSLSADRIEGWGSYKLNMCVVEVMMAMTCPNYTTGVILLNWRTLEEANA